MDAVAAFGGHPFHHFVVPLPRKRGRHIFTLEVQFYET